MILICDASNIAFVKRHGIFPRNEKKVQDYAKEYLIQEVIKDILHTATKYNAKKLVLAFDSKNTWRKEMYSNYKDNRDVEFDIYKEVVIDALADLHWFFDSATNALSLKVERCEADDVIYGVTQRFKDEDKVILSRDRDFIQLIDDKTKLYDPVGKAERYSENPELDLFIKCMRGDKGDNIFSAYPRVRETKLREAYEDPLKKMNLLEEKRKVDGERVKEHYEFNRDLIDLSRIPQEYYDAIQSEIDSQLNKEGYGYAKTLKAFGAIGLKNFINNNNSLSLNILKSSWNV